MFPDDGYDYFKHLRPIGGGVFVPSTDLPEELFGLEELDEDRDLIHPQVGGVERFLDKEILELLEGDVEAEDNLQDDFFTIANEKREGEEDFDEDYDDDLPDLIGDGGDDDFRGGDRSNKIYTSKEQNENEKSLLDLMFDKVCFFFFFFFSYYYF